MLATLDTLYEVQRHLLDEMPEPGTNVRSALDKLDLLIDELEAEFALPPGTGTQRPQVTTSE
jgi:hypothetical protein